MERISVSVRKPVKDSLQILCHIEDRPLSEMSAILIEEAMERRLNPKYQRRPSKAIFESPHIAADGTETVE